LILQLHTSNCASFGAAHVDVSSTASAIVRMSLLLYLDAATIAANLILRVRGQWCSRDTGNVAAAVFACSCLKRRCCSCYHAHPTLLLPLHTVLHLPQNTSSLAPQVELPLEPLFRAADMLLLRLILSVAVTSVLLLLAAADVPPTRHDQLTSPTIRLHNC
jgi:hypothetical protein